MSTIVITPGEAASDKQITWNNMIISNSYSKLFENDRYLIGACGCINQSKIIVDWLLNGRQDNINIASSDEEVSYEVSYVDKTDGSAWMVNGHALIVHRTEFPIVLGSGREIAIGYIQALGMCSPNIAYEAVLAASKWDIYTGNDIQVKKWKIVGE